MHNTITILGPTATGKTAVAALLAYRIGGEIVSCDSRQVYRGMDIGTGKDLADYTPVAGVPAVPYHLIDICEAGEKYNVFRFQKDCLAACEDIIGRGRTPILCGGSGLYIESVLRGYRMDDVPQNAELRACLAGKSLDELTEILRGYKQLHNKTDVDTAQRAIRAIEIAEYYRANPAPATSARTVAPAVEGGVGSVSEIGSDTPFPVGRMGCVIGIDVPREVRRERISRRLRARLDEGMVDEVRVLLEKVKPEDLIYYGLEYKFITLYILGTLSYDEMVRQLEIAIHQFAKRQMTYFRGMERRGVDIHWIDGTLSLEEKVEAIEEIRSRE